MLLLHSRDEPTLKWVVLTSVAPLWPMTMSDWCEPKMFLGITNLSKTIVKHRADCCHALSHYSKFLADFLFAWQLVHAKPTEAGIWCWKRNWQILTRKNGSLKPIKISKIHVIYYQNQFFSYSHTFFFLFMICQHSFEGLWKHVGRPVEPRSRFFQAR